MRKHKIWLFLFVIPLLALSYLPINIKAVAYEDFTSFQEVSDEYGYLTQNITHARWNQKQVNDSTWIYKDYGTDHFSGDLTHEMDLRLNQCDAGSVGNNWYNAPYKLYDDPTHWILIGVREAGTMDNIYDFVWKQKEGGDMITHFLTNSSNHYAVNITLYLRVTRTLSSIWTLYVYSDSGRTSLIESDVLSGWSQDYDQLNCTHAMKIGADSSASSGGWLRYLIINEFAIQYYFNTGGTFEENGNSVSYGEIIWYGGAQIVKFGALPENNTIVFDHFIIGYKQPDEYNITTNPYNYTDTKSRKVVLVFDDAPVGDGYQHGWYLAGAAILMLIAVPSGILIIVKRR